MCGSLWYMRNLQRMGVLYKGGGRSPATSAVMPKKPWNIVKSRHWCECIWLLEAQKTTSLVTIGNGKCPRSAGESSFLASMTNWGMRKYWISSHWVHKSAIDFHIAFALRALKEFETAREANPRTSGVIWHWRGSSRISPHRIESPNSTDSI